MRLRMLLGAVMTRHALALDDARRVRAGSDRARSPVLGIAMGIRTATKRMPFDDALEAATLGRAGDFHLITRREDTNADRVADFQRRDLDRLRPVIETHRAQHGRRRFETRLRGMPDGGLVRAASTRRPLTLFGSAREALRPKTQLDLVETGFRLRYLQHRIRRRFDDRARNLKALGGEDLRHADLLSNNADHRYSTLISTSTPAGRSSFVNASTVCARESRMSITRLCVLSSNCSRDFLSTCGERRTVHRCVFVGNGIGPDTCAPVFSAVRTMSADAWSITAWSNALSRIRMRPAIKQRVESRKWKRGAGLLQDLGDDAGADRAAALADGEPEPLVHGDRRDELDR